MRAGLPTMSEPKVARGVIQPPPKRKRQKIDPDMPLCPLCGNVMKWVTSRFGLFMGCRKYPKCVGKRPKEERVSTISPPA